MVPDYRSILTAQWQDVCTSFERDYNGLALRGELPKQLNEWYSVKCHRWSSVVYAEGQILDQVGNDAFAKTLRKALADFKFKKVVSNEANHQRTAPLIGLSVAVIVAVMAFFGLHWILWKTVLIAVLTLLGVTIPLQERTKRNIKNDEVRIKQDYMNQLLAQKETLLLLCEEFNID